jgi:hypothetical protein
MTSGEKMIWAAAFVEVFYNDQLLAIVGSGVKHIENAIRKASKTVETLQKVQEANPYDEDDPAFRRLKEMLND